MLSYEIADFLAWDRQIWLDLVAGYQARWWPLPWLWAAALVAAFWLGIRPRAPVCEDTFEVAAHGRRLALTPLLTVLAAGWLWIGTMFHGREHASLNWAADYWMWGCWAQAVLMLLAAILLRRVRVRGEAAWAPVLTGRLIGVLLLALLAPPMLALLLDQQPLGDGEWPGMTTGATAVVSLLMLALPAGRAPGGKITPGLRGLTVLAMLIPALLLVQEAAFGQVLGLATPLALLLTALSGGLFVALSGHWRQRP